MPNRVDPQVSRIVQLEELPTIKVPRCLRLSPEEVVLLETLHAFIDASQDAYIAIVYLRDYIR